MIVLGLMLAMMTQQAAGHRVIVGSVPSNPPIYSNECGGQCNVCGYDVICTWSYDPVDVPAINSEVRLNPTTGDCPLSFRMISDDDDNPYCVMIICADSSRYLIGPNNEGNYICHKAQN